MVEKTPTVKVPTMVELAKKKAAVDKLGKDKKPTKKKPVVAIAVGIVVVLVIIIALAMLFLVPKYKYSFNINGVDFVSNDYTPSEFFLQFKDTNSFLVVMDIKDGESNAWVVNAMNLWLVALNADHKSVQSLVRVMDSTNAVTKCSTNDGNILSNSDLNASSCNFLFDSSKQSKVVISLSNENKATMSAGLLQVTSSSQSTVSQVNYFVIKQMYSDFDKTLAIVNERINGIK